MARTDKFLLGTVLLLLAAFLYPAMDPVGINESFAETDEFPGNDTWGFYGTLTGALETEEKDLQLSSSTETGSYISDTFSYKDRIQIERVVVDSLQTSGSTEDITFTLRAINDEGVLIEEQTFNIDEDIQSLNVESFNNQSIYDSYEYEISITNPDTQHKEVESVTVDYTRYEQTNTSEFPIGFREIIFIILALLGVRVML